MIAYLLLPVFTIWLFFGLKSLFDTHALLGHASSTIGRVIALAPSSDNDGTRHSVIEFKVDGSTYIHQTGASSNPPMHEIGEQVKIVYNTADPAKNHLLTFMDLYGWTLAMGVTPGLVGLLLSLATIWSDRLLKFLHPSLY